MTTPSVDARPVPVTHHRTATVDGVEIFYREAGPADAPVVLLLHGFPTSSHMFRNLIPALADRYHVIAPGLSGLRPERHAGPRQLRLHLRPLRRAGGWAARPARRRALRHVRHGLRRAGRLAPGAQASRARHRPDRPERQRLRGRAEGVLGSDQGLLGRRLAGASRGAPRPGRAGDHEVPVHRRRGRRQPRSHPTTGSTTRRCSTARATPTSSWTCSTTTAPTCRSIPQSRPSSASTSRRR